MRLQSLESRRAADDKITYATTLAYDGLEEALSRRRAIAKLAALK
jgi:hypothetical protein